MLYDVILTQTENTYLARVKQWPELVVHDSSRQLAIQKVRQRLIEYLAQPMEIVQIDLELPSTKSWNNITTLERNKTMPYITSVEHIGREIGFKQGIEQGIAKGIEKGIEKGRQGEALALLSKLLLRRLGVLPTAILEKINALSLAALETLADDFLEFSSPSDLDIWFDRPSLQKTAFHPLDPSGSRG